MNTNYDFVEVDGKYFISVEQIKELHKQGYQVVQNKLRNISNKAAQLDKSKRTIEFQRWLLQNLINTKLNLFNAKFLGFESDDYNLALKYLMEKTKADKTLFDCIVPPDDFMYVNKNVGAIVIQRDEMTYMTINMEGPFTSFNLFLDNQNSDSALLKALTKEERQAVKNSMSSSLRISTQNVDEIKEFILKHAENMNFITMSKEKKNEWKKRNK